MIKVVAILNGRWLILLIKELQKDIIDQIKIHIMYLKQTDLLKKDILMFLDILAREYGGEAVDKLSILSVAVILDSDLNRNRHGDSYAEILY